jgi:hypothetical protein
VFVSRVRTSACKGCLWHVCVRACAFAQGLACAFAQGLALLLRSLWVTMGTGSRRHGTHGILFPLPAFPSIPLHHGCYSGLRRRGLRTWLTALPPAPSPACCSARLAAQTSVDDPSDEKRVNCVLTALSRSASTGTDGTGVVDKDFNIASLVHIAQPARFFRPSLGLEIVVRAGSGRGVALLLLLLLLLPPSS